MGCSTSKDTHEPTTKKAMEDEKKNKTQEQKPASQSPPKPAAQPEKNSNGNVVVANPVMPTKETQPDKVPASEEAKHKGLHTQYKALLKQFCQLALEIWLNVAVNF